MSDFSKAEWKCINVTTVVSVRLNNCFALMFAVVTTMVLVDGLMIFILSAKVQI